MRFTAKSVVFDFADNWGYLGHMGIRQIDFWYQGSKIVSLWLNNDFEAYATTAAGGFYQPKYAFDTDTLKTGVGEARCWYTYTNDTNQRIICVFAEEIPFEEIRINNWHSEGTETSIGVKNTVVQISTGIVTDTTYGALIDVSEEETATIFNGQIREHVASDVEDEETLTLSGGVPSYISVIYDGNGNTSGTVPTDTTEYQENDTATVLGNTGALAKTGYDFVGWNTASDGSGTSYVAGNTFLIGTTDVTLYAVWEEVFLSQFAFRFRNDDGSELAATWNAAENTNVSLAPGSKIRVRVGIDAEGDPASKDFQLEYRRKPSGGTFGDWGKVTWA